MSGTSGMSLSDDVPTPVRAFVDASSSGDAEAVVALFTPDAALVADGRELRGREEIAGWAAPSGFELLGVRAGDTEQEVVATVLGADGVEELRFTLRGDEIARLVVGD